MSHLPEHVFWGMVWWNLCCDGMLVTNRGSALSPLPRAGEQYNQPLAGVKDVINTFTADDSVTVRKAQSVLRDDTLQCDLA